EITRLRHAVDEALNRVLLAAQALPERRDDVLVRGESNLVASPDLADRAKLSTLFSAFEEKSDLLDLFDQCLNVDAVEIFIGAESGFSFLDDCSAIAAPYHHDGEVVGVLGVIGPTRMPYGLLVPMVGLSARMLSAALNRQL
ncbi:MAG: heat-inducible transcriptional repressor HrcA, partial [Gammaproteobacteria bacterium]|nr:heat-inducible transcriptional repressor HrcA [Gammaproteobacteria bacterium]